MAAFAHLVLRDVGQQGIDGRTVPLIPSRENGRGAGLGNGRGGAGPDDVSHSAGGRHAGVGTRP